MGRDAAIADGSTGRRVNSIFVVKSLNQVAIAASALGASAPPPLRRLHRRRRDALEHVGKGPRGADGGAIARLLGVALDLPASPRSRSRRSARSSARPPRREQRARPRLVQRLPVEEEQPVGAGGRGAVVQLRQRGGGALEDGARDEAARVGRRRLASAHLIELGVEPPQPEVGRAVDEPRPFTTARPKQSTSVSPPPTRNRARTAPRRRPCGRRPAAPTGSGARGRRGSAPPSGRRRCSRGSASPPAARHVPRAREVVGQVDHPLGAHRAADAAVTAGATGQSARPPAAPPPAVRVCIASSSPPATDSMSSSPTDSASSASGGKPAGRPTAAAEALSFRLCWGGTPRAAIVSSARRCSARRAVARGGGAGPPPSRSAGAAEAVGHGGGAAVTATNSSFERLGRSRDQQRVRATVRLASPRGLSRPPRDLSNANVMWSAPAASRWPPASRSDQRLHRATGSYLTAATSRLRSATRSTPELRLHRTRSQTMASSTPPSPRCRTPCPPSPSLDLTSSSASSPS